ncbi:Sensor protein ZraS [Marine Group I thaumarchaeote SCGC AAA799-E16]|uniref:Signal transduction histidine-protein kinase AtoS n=2 Tax=Marine Group I TaxID=905826 RepID=A0A087RSV5_9ARCH|nr:Sensor protein ZraS [Marine Group I thaumarchaeote SCGC AAA799-E16]KFM16559.1 Signal transduction histidine-protein kinase AtoS [Marine Group I thaumarchaeote SCGC RSA3]
MIPTIIATYNVGIDDTPFEIIVALLYPIVDSVLLTAAIIAILFSVWNKRNFFWIMILIGIMILITADTVFLFLIIDDTYTDGHPVDVLWVSAYTIWAFMMYYIINNSNQNSTEKKEPKKYKMERLDRFGIIIALILINVTIGIILISLNYFAENNSSENIIPYFSWFLITIVIMFSSIILFLNSKLNKTLLSRTVKLEELSQELIKSERFSAIGELSGRLAHDLRNPLSVIKMSVDLLRSQSEDKKISDPDVLKRIRMIDESIARISHQVDDVLGYVRNSPLKLSNLSVHKLIKSSIEKINVPENVEISISDKDANINCDPVKIDAVFINLISNAIQSILDGGGKISINISENTDNVKIECSDTRDGIPEDVIDKIFEPLFTTKQKGTGLGLAICRQIVEQHDGKIYAKNNPTTFIIEIPNNPKTN